MILAPPPSTQFADYLRAHGRSFAFAARLLPAAERARIAAVYAFCRYTDDLVDRDELADDAARAAALDAWLDRARDAHRGIATGIELLDVVIGAMGRDGIAFSHVEELVAGMRMDLRRERYPTLDALDVYRQRVAGVVGLWLTELSGVHDARVLAQAARLGRAMQLTNILRDVGEDFAAGRVYLPGDLLARYGIGDDELAALARGDASPDVACRYEGLQRTLMAIAEGEYAESFRAIPALPEYFQRTVAVAAGVYRGIHDELRRLGARAARIRARTSGARKLVLAAAALRDLRIARGHAAIALRVPNGSRGRSPGGSAPAAASAMRAARAGCGDGAPGSAATASRVAAS